MSKREVSLDGGAACRNGFTLRDNPFDMVSRRQSFDDWNRQFKEEKDAVWRETMNREPGQQ